LPERTCGGAQPSRTGNGGNRLGFGRDVGERVVVGGEHVVECSSRGLHELSGPVPRAQHFPRGEAAPPEAFDLAPLVAFASNDAGAHRRRLRDVDAEQTVVMQPTQRGRVRDAAHTADDRL
jgi:hypothetical protein